ncbi:MAG: hypothetical protein ACYT04_86640, partial [Nostoc sp.]
MRTLPSLWVTQPLPVIPLIQVSTERIALMCQPSVVTWTIQPVVGGTKLLLEHKGLIQKAIKLNESMQLSQPWQGK